MQIVKQLWLLLFHVGNNIVLHHRFPILLHISVQVEVKVGSPVILSFVTLRSQMDRFENMHSGMIVLMGEKKKRS